MKYRSPQEVFTAFSKLNVLIIGDVMVDSYIHGKVTRISPEAPVPVVDVGSREQRLGGAANVALNVLALGARPILCSVIGDDGGANQVIELMSQSGMDTKGILRSTSRKTTVKHRIIAGGHHLLRIDEEQTDLLDARDEKQLIEVISREMANCNVVVFEDYDKGCISASLISSVVEMARKAGVPVTVDPKKRNFLNYHNVDLFKPNLKEIREGLGVSVSGNDRKSLDKAVNLLMAQLSCKNALITLSEHGVYYSDEHGADVIPAHVRSIADVSGAGDTVITVASLLLAVGVPLSFLAEIANLAGGIVCEHPGVVPIDRDQLLDEVTTDPHIKSYFKG